MWLPTSNYLLFILENHTYKLAINYRDKKSVEESSQIDKLSDVNSYK